MPMCHDNNEGMCNSVVDYISLGLGLKNKDFVGKIFYEVLSR